MLLANVVFPPLSAAYLSSLYLPGTAIVALVTEISVMGWLQRRVASPVRLPVVVILANLISWVIGFTLSLSLPSGIIPQLQVGNGHDIPLVESGPAWESIAAISFVWACFLSFVIEYAVLKMFGNTPPYERLARSTLLANIASYCVLGAVVFLFCWLHIM